MVWALASLVVAASLMVAVDRGANMLGPVLLVVGGWAGVRTLRIWWRHLREEWFVAELVLVTTSWGLFGAALASLQYLVFSFAPSAFHVDVDYAQAAAPRYRTRWLSDSVRVGGLVARYDRVAGVIASGPEIWVVDSVTTLPSGDRLVVRTSCDELVVDRDCTWRIEVAPSTSREWRSIAVNPPPGSDKRVTRTALQQALGTTVAQHRAALAAVSAKLADPAGHVQPRIGDLFYETTIAFSGRDSGIFSPVGSAARAFKVLESLASYLLFGIMVARVSAAASTALSGERGPLDR